MRIVSLLPSATEILFALGLDREIVGVSHECDFPLRARTKLVVIHSRMPDDLATALARFERRPEVLCLNPQDLGDVWRDILWVGEEACRGPQAEALVKQIGARLGALEQQLPQSVDRPRVAFLEWLQPFYV